MPINIHRFSVTVNCNLADTCRVTDKLQDFQQLYEDYGFIILPENYSENGKDVRMVIFCHGAGGAGVGGTDSDIEHHDFTKYLVANGYAVMDVNGLPYKFANKNGLDIANNIGSPIAVRSYIKAYRYCMENFNLKPEVFVHGGSMGGISGTNLVLSGAVPVIAHSAFCPVLDTYNQIFLHPWTGGLPKHVMGKIYGFDTDESGRFIYDESKLAGYNPAKNKKAEVYPVPVKFWHCSDDGVVSYEATKKFIETIRDNGGIAYLRTLPFGGHDPVSVGEPLKKPCGKDIFYGSKLKITPVIEEMFIWIESFN